MGSVRCEWLPEFGNKRARKGRAGDKISDYAGGFDRLQGLVKRVSQKNRGLVLFCACENVSECHRDNVMRWLRKRKILSAKVYGEFPAKIYP